MVKNSFVSVIIPTYNERASLPDILLKISSLIDRFDQVTECIIVNDGSNDGSQEFLTDAQAKYDWLKVISFKGNRGKSCALAAGIQASNGQIILMMDGDLQDDPMSFPDMLEAMQQQNLDVVIGWRKQRQDTLFKQTISFLYNLILNLLFSMKLHDHNCGLRMLRSDTMGSIPLKGDWHRYLTVLSHYAGYKVGEVIVSHYPRQHGSSRYGADRYIKFISDLPTLYIEARKLKKQQLHH